jgi:hypothetical protein
LNEDKNGMWQYNISFQVLANANSLFDNKKLQASMKTLVDFSNKASQLNKQVRRNYTLFQQIRDLKSYANRFQNVLRILNNDLKSQYGNSNSLKANGFVAIKNLIDNPYNPDNTLNRTGNNILNHFN